MTKIEKIRFALVIGCVVFLLACSGVKKAIISAEAYSLTAQRGTVQVDEKGNETATVAATVITVYVESKYNALQFDSAWVNDRSYSVQTQMITNPLEVGFEENTGQKIIVGSSGKNYIYQLQVVPIVKKGEELPGSINIRLVRKGESVVKTVNPIKRIQPYDAQ